MPRWAHRPGQTPARPGRSARRRGVDLRREALVPLIHDQRLSWKASRLVAHPLAVHAAVRLFGASRQVASTVGGLVFDDAARASLTRIRVPAGERPGTGASEVVRS